MGEMFHAADKELILVIPPPLYARLVLKLVHTVISELVNVTVVTAVTLKHCYLMQHLVYH